MKAHVLGFPRIGAHRELKKALESYWHGDIDETALLQAGQEIRFYNWGLQRDAGLDWVTVGDFSWYDHVLDTSVMLGVVPPRFGLCNPGAFETYFRMARGRGRCGESDVGFGSVAACEMTKWFDTNYHYIVPEFTAGQSFSLNAERLLGEVTEAQAAGFNVKPVLLGPLSFLWLGKEKDSEIKFNRLDLLESILPVYQLLLQRLAALGIEWVQIDEPILVLDLPLRWRQAYESAYTRINTAGIKLLLGTYFGGLEDNLSLVAGLPVEGVHLDVVQAPGELLLLADRLPNYKILSAGIVDGRNIWRNDYQRSLAILEPIAAKLGERLWVGSSCSLLHCPVDLDNETRLDDELRGWLAFARQKLDEVHLLRTALMHGRNRVADRLIENRKQWDARRSSDRIHNAAVKDRLMSLQSCQFFRATPYAERVLAQRQALALPLFPTTTIGSFPQTSEIRLVRRDYKVGRITEETYRHRMQDEIRFAIKEQEALGLDVLVHGEAERNDMVEYFAELLQGFAITQNGWVQSYGSRCVKPPLIYGDVSRVHPMTVEWSRFAQDQTEKPLKGMLTGPVTMLKWSFVRDDQPLELTCKEIALALRDEVQDLETAGIAIIQIDEPAFREGLPLRKQLWPAYLDWAAACFRLASLTVRDETQIHTHMCYSEFNDIIEAIAALDADVITIETSRSDMELLSAFTDFKYPNELGPGVYDIHSPRVPDRGEMLVLLRKALLTIPPERLWVNPDCGLKTRAWPEVRLALAEMIAAANTLREG